MGIRPLIGGNNAGKSTICKALDPVLGPDRPNRTSLVEEFDFRNADCLNEGGETLVPIRIEAILADQTDDIKKLCAANWKFASRHRGNVTAITYPTPDLLAQSARLNSGTRHQ